MNVAIDRTWSADEVMMAGFEDQVKILMRSPDWIRANDDTQLLAEMQSALDSLPTDYVEYGRRVYAAVEAAAVRACNAWVARERASGRCKAFPMVAVYSNWGSSGRYFESAV